MASDLYCSRANVNRWIPAGAITFEGRIVASSLASNDTLTLDGHGFETDDQVTVRALDGGTLPGGLSEGTTYYVIRSTHSTFQLAAAAAGAAINITSNGTSVLVTREPDYDTVIEFYSRWADRCLPAEIVPLTTPLADEFALVRGLVAQLTAARMMNLDGKSSEIVRQAELDARAQLKEFAAGIPIRASSAARANLAVTSSYATTDTDPRGWGTGSIP